MSKKLYVSDDIAVISLDGLRYVSKEDSKFFARGKGEYSLEISYKGIVKKITYGEEKDKRDGMYDAIIEAVEGVSSKVVTKFVNIK